MTLALAGKSPRRRTFLVLGALGAMLAGTLAGLTIIGSALAHTASLSGTTACVAPGATTWHVDWKVTNDWPSAATLTSSVNHGASGPGLPATLPGGNGSFVTGASDVPVAQTDVTLSVKAVWADGYTQTPTRTIARPPTCATIIVKKVVTGAGADPGYGFTADIDNTTTSTQGQVNNLAFSQNTPGVDQFDDQGDPDTFTVAEDTPGGNWTITGKWLSSVAGDQACPAADSASWTAVSDTTLPSRRVSGGLLNDVGNGDVVTVCFRNAYTPPDRIITICKAVESNGIPPLDEGAEFGFDVRVQGHAWFAQVHLTAHEDDSKPVCTTVSLAEHKIPIDSIIEVVEWGPPSGWVNAAGYPHSNLSTNETAVLGTDHNQVTFQNKRATREIKVCKMVAENGDTTADGGTFTFDVRYFGAPPPYTKQGEFTIVATEGSAEPACTIVTVPSGVNVEIVEWMGAIGRPANWNGDAAGYPKYQVGAGSTVAGETALVTPNDSSVVFVNRTVGRTGTLTVNKVVVPQPGITEDGTFDLLVNSVAKASNVANGGTTGAMVLPTGSYNVSEQAGSLSGEPLSSYSQAIDCRGPKGEPVANPVALGAGDNVICTITNTRNPVASAPKIIVKKWNDPAADMTGTGGLVGGWPMTITGTSGLALGFTATQNTGTSGPTLGVALFDGIPEGTYTVSEASGVAGWLVVGSKLDAAAPDLDAVRDGAQSVTAHNGSSPTVDFYNQPRVNVRVTKIEQIAGGTGPGAGWTVTLTGCGQDLSGVTLADGTYTFTNLPPCATYSVSENVNSKAGFTPVGGYPTTVAVAATVAGQTYDVTFANIQIVPVCVIGCAPPQTPTTPTTPTATPVTPTATIEPLNPTASPTDVVLGEKTPGPGALATPIAPATGSGGQSTDQMAILFLAAAALIAGSAGLATLAVATRQAR